MYGILLRMDWELQRHGRNGSGVRKGKEMEVE